RRIVLAQIAPCDALGEQGEQQGLEDAPRAHEREGLAAELRGEPILAAPPVPEREPLEDEAMPTEVLRRLDARERPAQVGSCLVDVAADQTHEAADVESPGQRRPGI